MKRVSTYERATRTAMRRFIPQSVIPWFRLGYLLGWSAAKRERKVNPAAPARGRR